MPAALVVLQAPEVADASTGSNAAELVLLGIAGEVVGVPRGDAGGPAVQDSARQILAALRRRAGDAAG
jgi:hypothetical protein